MSNVVRKDVISQNVYSLIDSFFSRFVKLGAVVYLMGKIPIEDTAVLGLAASYLAIISLLLVAPETALFRVSRERIPKISEKISKMFTFNILRNIAIIVLVVLIGALLGVEDRLLFMTLIALTINQLLETTIEIFRIYFFVQYKQSLVTFVNIFNSGVMLIFMLSLTMSPTLLTYIIALVLAQLISLLIWVLVMYRFSEYRYEYIKDWYVYIYSNLKDFSVWQHLNANVTNLIYNIEIVIMSSFVGYTDLGLYATAQKISNFFFLIPMVLQKNVVTHLVNISREKVKRTLILYILLFTFLSGFQLLAFKLFGSYLIGKFFPQADPQEAFMLSLIIIVGISILNIVRPLMAYLFTFSSLRKQFFRIYLPTLLISLATYFYAASKADLQLVAMMNVVNYSIFALLLVISSFTLAKNWGRKESREY